MQSGENDTGGGLQQPVPPPAIRLPFRPRSAGFEAAKMAAIQGVPQVIEAISPDVA
jgi:hypothetical protein